MWRVALARRNRQDGLPRPGVRKGMGPRYLANYWSRTTRRKSHYKSFPLQKRGWHGCEYLLLKFAGFNLVGSVSSRGCPRQFSDLVSNSLPHHARRMPDGETGSRINWTQWQLGVFKQG